MLNQTMEQKKNDLTFLNNFNAQPQTKYAYQMVEKSLYEICKKKMTQNDK